jgi:hypothetical protein
VGEPDKSNLSLVGSQVSGSRHAPDTLDDDDDLSEDISISRQTFFYILSYIFSGLVESLSGISSLYY